MAITVELQYGVTFGKGDSSDWIDWEIDLDGEAEKAYERAKKLHLNLNEEQNLEDALIDAYNEIEAQEIENSIDYGDEYTLECLGKVPVDPNEINDRVADRDKHTLQFFGLTDMSDEELEEWDANDLDELPDICDFDEEFEPYSPYDEGWDLRVVFAEHPEEEYIDESEARETISELLDNNEIETLKDYVGRCEALVDGDFKLINLAAEIATEKGINFEI